MLGNLKTTKLAISIYLFNYVCVVYIAFNDIFNKKKKENKIYEI